MTVDRFIEAFKMGMLLVNRITEGYKMSEQDKEHVFTLLDAFIARTKLPGCWCSPKSIIHKIPRSCFSFCT